MSCSLHDVVSLESLGLPAVAIHTEAFASAAKVHANTLGRADYTSVFVDHPIAGISSQEVNARAEEIIETVAELLTA